MNHYQARELAIYLLNNIKISGPKQQRYGMCEMLEKESDGLRNSSLDSIIPKHHILGEFKNAMEYVCQTWEYYSGNVLFPIMHPDIDSNVHAFFKEPKWEGEYGRRRKELLHLIINRLKELQL